MHQSRTRRWSALGTAAVIAAVCLAACGSSSSTSSSSSASSSGSAAASTGGTFNRTKFQACLKAHGVTLPARPAGTRPPGAGGYGGYGGGGGFFFGGGGAGRGFAGNSKMRAAIQACGGGAFGRGRGFAGRRAAFSHTAVNTFVSCVRKHGYKLPSPNFSGKGAIFPANIERNATFQTAAKACASDLRPSGSGAAGAPGGATSSTTSG